MFLILFTFEFHSYMKGVFSSIIILVSIIIITDLSLFIVSPILWLSSTTLFICSVVDGT